MHIDRIHWTILAGLAATALARPSAAQTASAGGPLAPATAQSDVRLEADPSSEQARPSAVAGPAMLMTFQGPRAEEVNRHLLQSFQAAGVQLDQAHAEGVVASSPQEYAQLAKTTGVARLVSGTVVRSQGWLLNVVVRSETGEIIRTATFAAPLLPALLHSVDTTAVSKLRDVLPFGATPKDAAPKAMVAKAVAQKAPAPKALAPVVVALPGPQPVSLTEPQPIAETPTSTVSIRDEAPSPPAVVEPAGRAPTNRALQLRAGVVGSVRNLEYKDPVADSYNSTLLPHENLGMAMPFVALQWFPGAHFTDSFWANIGLGAEVSRSFGGNTVIYDENFTSVQQELLADVRGRFPLGVVTLMAFAGGGVHKMEVEGDNEVPALGGRPDPGVLPDLDYALLRFGFGADVRLSSRVTLSPAFAIRLPRLGDARGELGESRWFPNATADGLDARLTGSYALSRDFAVELGVDYKRYAFAMNPDPADVFEADSSQELSQALAGGATDSYVGIFLGGSYSLPGVDSR